MKLSFILNRFLYGIYKDYKVNKIFTGRERVILIMKYKKIIGENNTVLSRAFY